MKQDYQKIALSIIENVGGKENIKEMSHCMTRLRLGLKNESLVNKEGLDKCEGVMRVVLLGGQYQIVLGGIVDDVFGAASEIVGDSVKVNDEIIQENLDEPVGKQTIVNQLISVVSGIITPIIPAMLASGFITAIAKLAILCGVEETNYTIQLLTVAGDVLYGFFPIIVAWSSAKYFKANISLTLMVVGILVYPSFTSLIAQEGVNFLGLPVTNLYYGSSVLPAIFSALLLSKLEIFFRRILPNALRSIFVPFLSA